MTAYTLNLLDLAFTLHALNHGGVEINPVMRCVPIMIFYKTVIVGALCVWLSKRTEPLAKYGLSAITAVYAGICGWHLINIF